MKTLENGHLVQRVGVHSGNVMMNGQVFAHPSLGKYLEYVLAPWGAVPKAIGNSMQFQVRNLEMSFLEIQFLLVVPGQSPYLLLLPFQCKQKLSIELIVY